MTKLIVIAGIILVGVFVNKISTKESSGAFVASKEQPKDHSILAANLVKNDHLNRSTTISKYPFTAGLRSGDIHPKVQNYFWIQQTVHPTVLD